MDNNLDNILKSILEFFNYDNDNKVFDNKKLNLNESIVKNIERIKSYMIEKNKQIFDSRLYLQEEAIKNKDLSDKLKLKENEINIKLRILEDKEINIKKKEEDLLNRENNALNSFMKEQETAYKEHKEKIQSEIKLLSEQLNVLRNEKLKLEKDYNEQLKVNEEKLNSLFLERRNEIEKEENKIKEEKQELVDLKGKLLAKRDKLQEECKILESRQREYDNLLKQYNKQLEEAVDIKIADINRTKETDINSLKEEIKVIRKEYDRVLKEKIHFEEEEIKSGGLSKEELNKKIRDLEDLLKKERDKVLSLPTDYEQISNKASRVDELEEEIKTLQNENISLKSENFQKQYYVAQVDQLKNELTLKDFKCAELEAVLAECKEQLNIIKNKYAHTEEKEKRIAELKQSCTFTTVKNYIEESNKPREIDWVLNIHKKCEESEIIFDKRLLFAFHTALKSSYMSPLTILSGVSGTGKSELPKLYSRFGGLYFISLPVKPDWDSTQSLFGYFNSLDGKYNSTELLRAMIQFDAHNDAETALGFKDSILLVLLDEMNLAHVELYFSDLLSKLETRRGNNIDEYIDIDLGSGFNYKLNIAENILWTGTMNEDETTKALSDKVIDRGYQINFPIPNALFSRNNYNLDVESDALRYSYWKEWKSKNYIKNKDENTKHYFAYYNDILNKIKESLIGTGRGLGHRVWQSIDMYMRSHPINYHYYEMYMQNSNDNTKDNYKKSLEFSFEEALVYKVMPKLRGLETRSDITLKALEKIYDIIKDKVVGLKEDYEEAMNTPDDQFIWRSAKYLNNNKDFYDNIR